MVTVTSKEVGSMARVSLTISVLLFFETSTYWTMLSSVTIVVVYESARTTSIAIVPPASTRV